MNKNEKKEKIVLQLPHSTRLKAQTLSNTLGVTMSHLVEGLIEGVQITSSLVKEHN